LYLEGKGVAQDDIEANKWFQRAAEQGDATSQFLLATAYVRGTGVAKDSAAAVHWFRLSAEGGVPAAQFNLGILYDRGQVVDIDPIQAYAWARIAASAGHPEANSLREILAAKLAPEQLAEAEAVAAAFKPRP
jgi:TPR repeat protein